ncbi:S8 family peptidase [Paenibacillus alvei]|uniref:S8 family peptidase n=1 Tax=Paenibacillus alvei TaxID=44250 RepID=UPI00148B444D|nr:S8 family peptidase [Paenibacillus alvei]
MRKFCFLLLICLLAASFTFAGEYILAQEAKTRYLISFQTSIDYNLIHTLEGKIVREYQEMPVVLVEISESKASKLNDYSQIQFYEPDLKIKGTPEIEALSESGINPEGTVPLSQSTQEIPWGIEKVNALKVQEKGFTGQSIKIGIIDSGIDYKHDDLLVFGGISFVDGNPDYLDDHGHGTSVAGIIGARNNDIGILGIAPESELYAIKVLDSNANGNISDVVSGIEWSIQNKMNIVNLSLETTTDSKILKKAVKEAYKKGLLLVSAAGNYGFNEGDTIAYPAAYKEVIAVGAINSRNERTFYSASGKDLELMAPGASIFTTSLNNQFAMNLGTSMASSHVAGVAALIWQANPQLENKDIRKILDRTATEMGEKRLYGHGLVDAWKALDDMMK